MGYIILTLVPMIKLESSALPKKKLVLPPLLGGWLVKRKIDDTTKLLSLDGKS